MKATPPARAPIRERRPSFVAVAAALIGPENHRGPVLRTFGHLHSRSLGAEAATPPGRVPRGPEFTLTGPSGLAAVW